MVEMHVHAHGAGSPTRVLKISLGVTLAYIVLLVVAGIRAHSLALLSEAGHNLSDFLALLLSGFFIQRRWWIKVLLFFYLLPWAIPSIQAFVSVGLLESKLLLCPVRSRIRTARLRTGSVVGRCLTRPRVVLAGGRPEGC